MRRWIRTGSPRIEWAGERFEPLNLTMPQLKSVLAVLSDAPSHWVGDGFPVRTLLPSRRLPQMSPFLMLDYAGPHYFPPSRERRGVGEHPHRGFETVTLAYQGAVDHRDSGGHAGSIQPGDVQWMTAASGVVHEEFHSPAFTASGGDFEMVQLWVNLPAAHKMDPPRYQAIESSAIPNVPLGGGAFARLIAGELAGARGPARTVTPLTVADIRLSAGATGEFTLPENHNAALVLLRGDAAVNGERLSGEALVAPLGPEGDTVQLSASSETLLLLLAGEPILEPVASYGPFVMNTEEEIRQAIDDYRAGRMGRLD